MTLDSEFQARLRDAAGYIFDMDGTLHGKYRSLDRATAALRAAQPVIKTEVELELEADEVPA